MNKGNTMLAVFNPPSGTQLYGVQDTFVGHEIHWLAVEPDPQRKGHWLLCPQYQKAKSMAHSDCNMVTSAYLNQVEELTPKEYEITTRDVYELDRRIATIQKKRDALMAKLNENEKPQWKVGSYGGSAPIEDLMQQPEEGRIMSVGEAKNPQHLLEERMEKENPAKDCPDCPDQNADRRWVPEAETFPTQFDPNFFKRELLILRNEIDGLIKLL